MPEGYKEKKLELESVKHLTADTLLGEVVCIFCGKGCRSKLSNRSCTHHPTGRMSFCKMLVSIQLSQRG